ncbi:MAG: hypothetical protein A3E37_02225 [Candidatus Andersenbacteria bacterium RIFCSPHIGHO2_12_FULL_46_9]|nr:MAG: Conserved repeat domain protein [Parcubacteria group bacterium GW2011_GWA2_45_14]OGY34565.1 MAG: hypothetical protein A3B76_06260 [Candidatus Andersenbacteria bacterium RIFCSPHIGHO2_02_FULL_46_16]OGY36357.1 MAG: hypothetical protein A3E37_02225 [Candidatus Andersenbacteria bacterium RIFCSPHIGHO2_12_FULL_46_9]OGY37850.1 MAG: hypothetical protein A3I08_01510 [Candidatus Andersenbacteria bacterium RIFCSPLOWO2_02_FULL_46_11]OGY41237.1 MAG: hypothetical protein A3G57_03275 [Candidatus Anders
MTKTDHRAITRPGHVLTYEITVKNDGEGTVDDLVVTDTIPSLVAITRVSSGGFIEGRTITWSDIAISGGETLTFFVEVKVDKDASDGKSLVNSVKARSENKGLSDTDTDTTIVSIPGGVKAVTTTQPTSPIPVPVTAATGAGATSVASIVMGSLGLAISIKKYLI